MWEADWDRKYDYTLLTLSLDGEVRGSITIRDKDEEKAWVKALEALQLNQKQKQE